MTCCTTLKIMLVLLPHVTCNLILPLISLDPLTRRHRTYCQFTHVLGMRIHLEVRQFIIAIHTNLLRIPFPDEAVKHCKRRWNLGLNIHVILWWKLKDSKTTLEDPKDPLHNITSRRVMQIEQFLGVAWTSKNVMVRFFFK